LETEKGVAVDRFDFDDVELSYEVRDGGEPVVFVHAAPFVSWYRPLLGQLPGFATLTYRRQLRKPDDGPYRPLTVTEDAAICTQLLDHVGWTRAHVVGHSYGALVALQMAIDTPSRVHSVVLLEPATRGISSSAHVVETLQPVIAAYRAGDVAGAVDGFLRLVCGDDYRRTLEQVVPGAVDEAVAAADQFFQAEMAAVRDWSFGPGDAERVTQPVLNAVGTDTVRRFVEGGELIQSWFPHAERLSVPGAGHLLMVQNPVAVGDGLRAFFSRHPISAEQTELVDR
jgi:pimeloyl-ACP methyl ester carboxylesterase